MILKYLTIGGRRLQDDRGSVGVLVAIVMFFVLGMLAMTYNTARLSTEKMRLQNAVDAAALEHAAWQARGMNMIQNLNNEGFTGLMFSDEFICIAVALNAFRMVCEGLAKIPNVVTMAIFKALEVLSYYVVKALLFIAKWISRGLVGKLIPALQTIAKFMPIAGYASAQQLAQLNGAEAIGGKSAFIKIGDMSLGAFALGTPMSELATAFVLPVEKETFAGETDPEVKAPWVCDNKCYKDEIKSTNSVSVRKNLEKDVPEFEYYPMVSKKRQNVPDTDPVKWVLPTPCVWFCYKDNSQIRLMPLTVWDVGFDTKKGNKPRKRLEYGHGGYSRMVAFAAAKCVTGDVVKQSVTAKKDVFCIQRPAGIGTGATAKLVPVTSVFADGFFKDHIDKLIYH